MSESQGEPKEPLTGAEWAGVLIVGLILVMMFVGMGFLITGTTSTPPGQFPQGVSAPYGWVEDSAGHIAPADGPGSHTTYPVYESHTSLTPQQETLIGLGLIGGPVVFVVAIFIWARHRKAAEPQLPREPNPGPPSPAPSDPQWQAHQIGADGRFLPLPEPLEPFNPQSEAS